MCVCSFICIALLFMLLLYFRRSLMATYQYWLAICLVDVVTAIPHVVREQSLLGWRELRFERGTWTCKVYLDDGQFEKLDKVVADCENADDNYEPAARHLKHEQVFSKMQSFDHIAYKTYNTLSLPLPSNFDIIAQWSSVYTGHWEGFITSRKISSKVLFPNLSQSPAIILDQYQHCRSQTINLHELLSS